MKRARKQNPFEYDVMCSLDEEDRVCLGEVARERKMSMSAVLRSMVSALRREREQVRAERQQAQLWAQMQRQQQGAQ